MKFLKDPKIVFLLFILLAILFPQGSKHLILVIFPAVIIVTTLNIYDARFHSVGKENMKLIMKLLAINYVLLGLILILSAIFFVDNPEWKFGLILLGIAPPAMAIIPFTHLLKADTHDGALAEYIGYLIAIIVVPICTFLFVDSSINPFMLIQIVLAMLIMPIVFSKILSNRKLKYVEETGNLFYGIIIYVMVGLTLPTLVNDFSSTIPIFIILILTTFVLGAGVYVLLINKHIKEEIDILYVLFATLKNGGVASVLAIVLVAGSSTFVPIGIREMLLPFYILFLQIIAHHHHKHVRNHKHMKHASLKI